jgi:hypothetical protein
MDTQAKRALRLIAALELLAAEEQSAAGQGGKALASIQQRAAPLIEDLAKLATYPSVAVFRPRVEALVARRENTARAMANRVEALRTRLIALAESRAQMKRVAPAYGTPRRTNARFAQSV